MSARVAAEPRIKVTATTLNPELKSQRAADFETRLGARIVGQDEAVRTVASIYQMYLAGMSNPRKPIGNLLFLGPTGSGKTRVVEAVAEILFGDPLAVTKVDCAEFQHSHEISKLIGSPPGYLGHRETSPMLSQENLGRHQLGDADLALVLFDEIEKASDALWQLLLGILDKGTLTLGDNRAVDFSRTIIFMTSNLGGREMSDLINCHLGFAPPAIATETGEKLDQKMCKAASEAARRRFSPEFMNRLDKVVVFRSLTAEHIREILNLELDAVQHRILQTAGTKFLFECTEAAREFLLTEGMDRRYGARHLKRSIERHLVFPFANLVASGQVSLGDLVIADYAVGSEHLAFKKQDQGALSIENLCRYPEYFLVPAKSDGAGAVAEPPEEDYAYRAGARDKRAT